ncbi:MAG: DNA (cytosine-5-)-methyltransferase [Gammaproteobacteria bacterium]|nr:MAG: DNA (cytosine-5-)-methyltransferase [Gammaproteobacteria bacterium]RKZ74270.1 MAG: DNA (cytosine-5-)-methyltransferase [Gammaproteobacteria bacterium]
MKTIDLFSGCGGLSLGFQTAGYEILAAFDNWEPAIKIYKENFNHPIYSIDLSSLEAINEIKKYDTEIIIGGPPCQDFSSAGKRNETLGRSDLTINFANIVATIKPKWFVMENVEQIVKSYALKRAKKIFKNAGYALCQIVLNANLVGVPQNRKRFFLLGEFNEINNTIDCFLQKNIEKKAMTVHDYLGDSLATEYYYRHPRSYQRRGIFSIYEPSPTIRGVNRPIPPNYQFHSGDAIKDLSKVRPLTTKERALIQTFPDDFVFLGTKSNMEQIIGNAVPVKLAEYVAKIILIYAKSANKNIKRYEQLMFNF